MGMQSFIQSLLNNLQQMSKASLTTIALFFITFLLSLPLGLAVMYLYKSKNKIIKNVVGIYILIMRGTPLMLQLLFIVYGLPKIPFIGSYVTFDRFTAAVIGFVLNYSAYFAEIFRGGMIAIDKGQYEASKVLGLSKVQTNLKVILPQMIRVCLPSIGNEAIILVKDTSLVTIIGVIELMATTKNIVSASAQITPFAIAAVFYLVMSWVLTVFFNHLEKRYSF